jgi:hypothetical protein
MHLRLLNMSIINKILAINLNSKYNLLKSISVLVALLISLLALGFERLFYILNPRNFRKVY